MPPEGAGATPAAIVDAAAAVGVSVNAATAMRLLSFLDLLQRWNATYNLTAVRELAQMRVQHLNDCLAVIAPLRRKLPNGGRLLDVGSGGGLPGVVIAAVCPDIEVTCVDAVGKKAAFIRQAAAELAATNLRGEHARVESVKLPPFDVITSRAFASLADFVRLTWPLLAPGGVWLAMKGKRPDDEIKALPANIDVFHVEQLTVPELDAERCIVWMRPRGPAGTL
ncbi:MAG TPA: 16S rRNA (guanine(527)-N(7))-methyltransferase RsmG [Albitalea sp.]|nr:16S rRNA (guanine(527)-N(7))-methyltransferase RsmG [Albitalea sp.]